MRTFAASYSPLVQDPVTGVYWSNGIDWSTRDVDLNNLDVVNRVGTARTSIIDRNTRQFDTLSSTISYDCLLGGKVYIDPRTGSVRFSGAMVPRDSRLEVLISANAVRVSTWLAANYRNASLVFDDRFYGERSDLNAFSYWGNSQNNGAAAPDPVRNDRFMLTFTRSASEGTQISRPFMRTLRFGIQLPTAVATDNDGVILGFQVQNMPAGSFYQVEPATGKVYFTSEAEDLTNLVVRYTGIDEQGRVVPNIQVQVPVTLLEETVEATVPIEQPVNEASMTVAIDPININGLDRALRRPGLYWLFWTSTRGGVTDVYFQTIAPRFSSLPTN
jgi:hypothetical protein